MKTLRHWFTRNRVLSHLRITTAVTLTSAAAAMAFVAANPSGELLSGKSKAKVETKSAPSNGFANKFRARFFQTLIGIGNGGEDSSRDGAAQEAQLAGVRPEWSFGGRLRGVGVHRRHGWHDLFRTHDGDRRCSELYRFELCGLYRYGWRRRLAGGQRACLAAELASVEQRHPIERDRVSRLRSERSERKDALCRNGRAKRLG